MKFLGFLLLLLIVAGAVAGYFLIMPFGPTHEVDIEIPAGTSSGEMAQQLEQAGVIRSRYAFLGLRLAKQGVLKAGEYSFDHPAPVTEVYDRIVRGDVSTKSLTIPEGYNIFDIARAVEAAGFTTGDAFLAATRAETPLIAEWSPHATSLEGYLFPDTYKFPKHAQPVQILTAMVKRFRQNASQMGLTGDVARMVTMASLVEKEVSVDNERPMVAGVFVNRLEKEMPLATDPTVIYAALLNGRWRGTIYASDLAYDSPYNTYKHAGLPPGPICNPGVAALKAAMKPADTNYLYFVADAAGHSVFSEGLKEHTEQVQAYRKAVKSR